MMQKNMFNIKNYKFYSDFNNFKNFFLMILKLASKLYRTEIKGINRKNFKIVNIHINDWLTSSLFPFNLFLGILLSNKYKVVFLFDKFNLYNNTYSFLINYFCELILKTVKKKFTIDFIILGQFKIKESKSLKRSINIKKMYEFNMMRYGRDVSFKIIKDEKYLKKINQATNIYKHVEYLIASKIISNNCINFISGGYLNSSYFLNILFRKNKINFYSFDSGPYKNGHAIHYCKNGIAGKTEESGIAFKNLNSKNYFNRSRMKKIKKAVLKEISKKRTNKSAIKYFQSSKEYKIKNNFAMITLNSGWDASSLDTSYLFPDYITFLRKTCAFFKKELPNIKLILRNHPYRNTGFLTADSVEKISKQIANKNVYFLEADDANFYKIIENCKLLISVSSTTINEALILNTPSISAGKDQYYLFDLGINCKTEKKFFKEIKDILLNKKKQKINKNKIFILYYFNHIKKYIYTDFTPQDFNWSKYNISHLKKTTHFKIVEKMIKTNKTFIETILNFH
jgi:hypothetical protein